MRFAKNDFEVRQASVSGRVGGWVKRYELPHYTPKCISVTNCRTPAHSCPRYPLTPPPRCCCYGDRCSTPNLTPPPLSAAPSPPHLPSPLFQLWWPLLFGLSEAIGDPRPSVRSSALSALSHILTEHGAIFSPQTWGLLFRGVVNPVFENAITEPTQPLSSEWPGQEPGPLQVAAAAADKAEEDAVARAAEEKAAAEERAAKKAAVRGLVGCGFFFFCVELLL